MKDLKLTPQYDNENNFIGFYISLIYKGEVYVLNATYEFFKFIFEDECLLPYIIRGKNNELFDELNKELALKINQQFNKLIKNNLTLKPLFNNLYEVYLFDTKYVAYIEIKDGILSYMDMGCSKDNIVTFIASLSICQSRIEVPPTETIVTKVEIEYPNLETVNDGCILTITKGYVYTVNSVCGSGQQKIIPITDNEALLIKDFQMPNGDKVLAVDISDPKSLSYMKAIFK